MTSRPISKHVFKTVLLCSHAILGKLIHIPYYSFNNFLTVVSRNGTHKINVNHLIPKIFSKSHYVCIQEIPILITPRNTYLYAKTHIR